MKRKFLLMFSVLVLALTPTFTGCEADDSSVVLSGMTENLSSSSANNSSSSKTSSEVKNTVTNTAPTGTPVNIHGQLSVNGNNLVDQNDKSYQLRGMSTHGLTWYPQFVNKDIYSTLRDDWKVNCIRLAMYVDESTTGGSEVCYLKNQQGSMDILSQGMDICLELGMYVIIDWHVLNPGNPAAYTNEAKSFFSTVSALYKDYPNVIYEVCNEPNGDDVTWELQIRPYCEDVISTIRQNDGDAVIIAGTGNWSQDVNDVKDNPLTDKNTMYAVHYYAGTHKDTLRNRTKNTYNNGIPIIVSEFSNCDADGNGINNFDSATEWLQLLDSLNISYINWNISDKAESSSIFIPNSGIPAVGFTEANLTESGKFVRNWFISRATQVGQ